MNKQTLEETVSKVISGKPINESFDHKAIDREIKRIQNLEGELRNLETLVIDKIRFHVNEGVDWYKGSLVNLMNIQDFAPDDIDEGDYLTAKELIADIEKETTKYGILRMKSLEKIEKILKKQ